MKTLSLRLLTIRGPRRGKLRMHICETISTSTIRHRAGSSCPRLKKYLDRTCTYTSCFRRRVRARFYSSRQVSLCLLRPNRCLLSEDVIYETDVSFLSHRAYSGCRFLDLRERTGQ